MQKLKKHETFYCLNEETILLQTTPIYVARNHRWTTLSREEGDTYNFAKNNTFMQNICLFKNSQTFKCFDWHCIRQITESLTDKGIAKHVNHISPRYHAGIHLVKVKDTQLVNDNLHVGRDSWVGSDFRWDCVQLWVLSFSSDCARTLREKMHRLLGDCLHQRCVEIVGNCRSTI